MIFLLDTHLLLWWAMDDPVLPKKARALIADPNHVPLVSPVSFWEISIKRSLGKISFGETAMTFFRQDLSIRLF